MFYQDVHHHVNSRERARALIAQARSLRSVLGSKIVHCTLDKAAMERALSYLLIGLVCLMTRPINQAIAVRGI